MSENITGYEFWVSGDQMVMFQNSVRFFCIPDACKFAMMRDIEERIRPISLRNDACVVKTKDGKTLSLSNRHCNLHT